MSAKHILYNGCVVESLDGTRRMFISQFGSNKEDLFVSARGFMRVKDYNDHLVYNKDESYNIVAIYDYPAGFGLDGIYSKDLIKVWDVGKVTITISEIAHKFGCSVDRIAIVK